MRVPSEAEPYCMLTAEQIKQDGDEGAAEVYGIESEVAGFVTTDIARAIVDVNRAENDRSPDGVVKTHTCWSVPVYSEFPGPKLIERLLARYYRPYHARLRKLGGAGVRLGVDCHTMATEGPPIGPDAGSERPQVCLSNADSTCPAEWIESLAHCFERNFAGPVSVNAPFRGGYLIRSHASELPWLQLEVSRAPFMADAVKRELVLITFREWCCRANPTMLKE
jgi:formiminoglutamase